MEPIFELKQVTHKFGQFVALADLNLQVFAGERVAIVGSSGAGKSTLLQLLNGSLLPTEGEVWAFGRNLRQLNARQLRRVQRQIGTIYQQLHLVDPLPVIHNVNAGHLGRWSFAKALWSLMVPQEVETAQAALAQVGIPEKLYARTDQLSGGQQQRVALARVLVQNPIAILADEPIASLDPERGREIMELLSRLCRDGDRALVVSLHLPDIAQQSCDRILGLRQGRLVFDTPASQVTLSQLQDLYQLTHVTED
ncbi:MAG: ATP-binding cassette domain-containing protein [Leptolyngbyaceae cyanobacterium bins.302]|nr:ATP-binding cassette domain-containing protein [Leptolyngbyaceae cyanobacterium bins.302]